MFYLLKSRARSSCNTTCISWTTHNFLRPYCIKHLAVFENRIRKKVALYPLITDSLDSWFYYFNSRCFELERQSILYYPLILNYILIGIKYTKRTPRIFYCWYLYIAYLYYSTCKLKIQA